MVEMEEERLRMREHVMNEVRFNHHYFFFKIIAGKILQ